MKNRLQKPGCKKVGLISLVAFWVLFFNSGTPKAWAQTKGLIVKAASAATPGAGRFVLDPDGDGYVSKTTNGLQRGFQSNDLSESEIPYRPLPVPAAEPMNDLLRGPNGGFSDFADMAGTVYPVSSYLSPANNLMFRFRLGGIAPNSKGYSILVDADGKFGFSGANADPEASADNPGFEFEIMLATNFAVRIYDINNNTGAATQKGTDADLPYSVYAQKAIAYTTNSGNADYFYDFYLPFSKITQYFPTVTTATSLRMVANTIMAPQSAIKGPVSDISGVGAITNIAAAWTTVINGFVPTAASGTTTAEFPAVKSIAPVISSTLTANVTQVSGTSTEADGTVITIYQNGAAVGTGTVAGGTWTFTLPTGTVFKANDRITARATATGKSISDLSNEVIVQSSCSQSTTPVLGTCTASSLKGIDGTVPGAVAGTTVRIYNIFEPTTVFATVFTGDNASTVGATTNTQTVFVYKANASYSNCNSGSATNMPNGSFFVTSIEAGKCESGRSSLQCYGSGTTTAPTLTQTTILQSTTTLSGTITSPVGTKIVIFVDGIVVGQTTVTTGTAWSISNLTFRAGQTVEVYAVANSTSCPAGITRTVINPSTPPIVSGPVRAGATTVTGTSSEPAGTGINVSYTRSGTTTALTGTALVQANGTWSFAVPAGVTLATNDVISATATAPNRTASVVSNTVTVTATPAAVPSVPNVILVSGVTYKEGGTRVDVSVPANTPTGTQINLYIDGYLLRTVATTSTSTSAFTLSFTGLSATEYELYTGGKLQATAGTIGSNESALSNNTAGTNIFVECVAPTSKAVTMTSTSVCEGSQAEFSIASSEDGVIYTLSNGTTERGASKLGTGSAISFATYELYATETFTVTAQKVSGGTCSPVSLTGGTVTVNPVPVATKTVTAPGSVNTGQTSNVTVKASQAGYLYQLRKGATNIGAAKTGTGEDLLLPTDAITTETTYNVVVTDITKSTNCTVQLSQMAKIGVNALPVELVKFTGRLTSAGTQLEWVTASEKNNAYFLVERSQNGTEFTSLTKVNGNGTTSHLSTYQFLDTKQFSGKMYYRLKQVDLDGTSQYSQIVTVTNGKVAVAEVVLYPNPTAAHCSLQITNATAQKVTITIFDSYGRLVNSEKVQLEDGKALVNLKTQKLAAGMYVITITGQTLQANLKLQKVSE